jgi:hypothetical protein
MLTRLTSSGCLKKKENIRQYILVCIIRRCLLNNFLNNLLNTFKKLKIAIMKYSNRSYILKTTILHSWISHLWMSLKTKTKTKMINFTDLLSNYFSGPIATFRFVQTLLTWAWTSLFNHKIMFRKQIEITQYWKLSSKNE